MSARMRLGTFVELSVLRIVLGDMSWRLKQLNREFIEWCSAAVAWVWWRWHGIEEKTDSFEESIKGAIRLLQSTMQHVSRRGSYGKVVSAAAWEEAERDTRMYFARSSPTGSKFTGSNLGSQFTAATGSKFVQHSSDVRVNICTLYVGC